MATETIWTETQQNNGVEEITGTSPLGIKGYLAPTQGWALRHGPFAGGIWQPKSKSGPLWLILRYRSEQQQGNTTSMGCWEE